MHNNNNKKKNLLPMVCFVVADLRFVAKRRGRYLDYRTESTDWLVQKFSFDNLHSITGYRIEGLIG